MPDVPVVIDPELENLEPDGPVSNSPLPGDLAVIDPEPENPEPDGPVSNNLLPDVPANLAPENQANPVWASPDDLENPV